MDFREKWLAAVDKKNSVLCAGLDPAEFAMGRGDKGLPSGTDKRDWAFQYLDAVKNYIAALKPNLRYWLREGFHATNVRDVSRKGDLEILKEIMAYASSLGIVTIQDSKEPDIGDTNDAGLYYAVEKVADAVTFSPFAGNLEQAVQQAHARELGLISMCLMSNPEFEREKDNLVPVKRGDYWSRDVIEVELKDINLPYIKKYVQLASDARKFGADGIVIGAPSPKNHIKPEEIAKAREYAGPEMLVLLPGVGAQGGEAGEIWKYFGKDRVIVNVGRGLMFPNGSSSTPQQQAETAKHYQEMLNTLRSEAA